MDAELIWKLKYYENADTVVASNHMMFPMVGLVSARVWAGLSDDDKAAITTIMQEKLSGVIDTYVAEDPNWMAQVEGTGKTYKTVGPEFFGDAAAQWEAKWSEKSSQLSNIRAAAASVAE